MSMDRLVELDAEVSRASRQLHDSGLARERHQAELDAAQAEMDNLNQELLQMEDANEALRPGAGTLQIWASGETFWRGSINRR